MYLFQRRCCNIGQRIHMPEQSALLEYKSQLSAVFFAARYHLLSTCSPSTHKSPVVGASKPPSIRRSVDFPPPEGGQSTASARTFVAKNP